ncbi:HBS1-like protein, partial [Trifolium medium]|nr:HBS1-like protein [Trifolium medium]
MPRKVNYGIDYYDDDYEDYDDDYDYDVDTDNNYGAGEGPDTKQETIKPGVWGCSICTYDNDESMTSCDICGVMRHPVVNNGTSNSNKTGN